MRWYPHGIQNIDEATKTADCNTCGRVKIVRKSPQRWRCAAGQKIGRNTRAINLKATYGLSVQEWDSMLVAQSGRCAICAEPMTLPNVDHCHRSGRVRGLLCALCNKGLGLFKEDLQRLRQAALYLQ